MTNKTNIRPPQWPLKLLRWFLKPAYLEEIEGDMEEIFEDLKNIYPPKKSRRLYAWEILRLLRFSLIREFKLIPSTNTIDMLRNHFMIAFRSMRKGKSYTVINLLGLTLGITCCLLISLWLKDELRYDSFHANSDRLYRLLKNDKLEDGEINTLQNTAYPIGDALMADFPEVEARTRYSHSETMYLNIEDELVETKIAAADPNFFEVFTFPLVLGGKSTCLKELNYVVISEDLATHHFENENALGKVVTLNADGMSFDFIVQGVFRQIPGNSSLTFDAIIPIQNYTPFHTFLDSWGNSWLTTYLLLRSDASAAAFNEKIKRYPKSKADIDWFTLMIQPFADQYLYSRFNNGQIDGGRIDYVRLFGLIALFTLLIACFNFVNLTTARSNQRAREIGVRKVLGANKKTLINQFVVESGVMVFISAILALLAAFLMLPFFKQLTAKQIEFSFSDPQLYLLVGIIFLVTLLSAAIYPAIFLSSQQVIQALKGRITKYFNQLFIQKSLVTFQFSLATVLISGTIVVFQQMTYMQNKNMGLDLENVVYLPLNMETGPKISNIKTKLQAHTSIENVSASDLSFIRSMGSTSDPKWNNGNQGTNNTLWFSILDVDFGFFEMMQIPVVEGRYFSPLFSSDTINYMINQAAAKAMELENPIGETLEFWGSKGKIVGVLEDFHVSSLHSSIKPMIIRCQPGDLNFVYVKTKAGQTNEAVAYMEKVHNEFSQLDFNIHFLDTELESTYRREMTTQKVAGIFTIMATIICCLGLLGLASFAVQQRVKEIAVRKILGAKVFQLMHLLFKNYMIHIIVSALISIPIAYIWLSDWLDNFAYKISLQWWIFLLPAIILLGIALLTISKLAWKTTKANPVTSLRNE